MHRINAAPAETPVVMPAPRQFYLHSAVQERIAEYCGGAAIDPESFSAEYLSGMGESFALDRYSEEYFFSASRSSFFWLLEQGVDIFRSVWDRTSTLGVLDVEYFSLNYPAEAYFKPERVFELLEPVYGRILAMFRSFGIEVVPIMTGQGYHFTFRIGYASKAHADLAALGRLEKTLAGKYALPAGRRTRAVPPNVSAAFDGMGRVLEYFAHLLIKDLRRGYKGVPVVCTDLSVDGRREAVALDLSMYGDPLFTRDIRCPFSTYQKHKVLQGKYGSRAAREVPVLVTLPRLNGVKLAELLALRKDFEGAQAYAQGVSASIPDSSDGFLRLVRSYRSSKLARFHAYFDSAEHDRTEIWPFTYDRFELDRLPPCVAHSLYFPNDNLLKPTNLQAITRVLLKLGWHPRHIAGLVRSKLERDYGWGVQWFRYDAATRANFYVRMLAGLIACGIDREEDLNCRSHAEKGYCLRPNCGHDLADYRLGDRPPKSWFAPGERR